MATTSSNEENSYGMIRCKAKTIDKQMEQNSVFFFKNKTLPSFWLFLININSSHGPKLGNVLFF
jgi:hypothetical protein